MVTAPHHLASEAGLRVLREGGNAIEAMLAAAAAIAVVYPHMNAIGGDGFWLIRLPGQAPRAIDACGAAAAAATPQFYRDQGFEAIPARGPLAANTVAGTLSGWDLAQRIAKENGGRFGFDRLLEDATYYAENGVAVTSSQHDLTTTHLAALADQPGFAEAFLEDGWPLPVAARLRAPALAATLRRIAEAGPDDFYRGDLARAVAADLAHCGSPVSAEDLATHKAQEVTPLTARLSGARLFNLPPPTQGVSSLAILALYDRMVASEADGFDHLHRLVEATKQAFILRDSHVTDPRTMVAAAQEDLLDDDRLAEMAAAIDLERAAPWPAPAEKGDTVWLGAVDAEGCAVSFIQSLYWEYGSGVVLPETGVLWQNRGSSFSLDPTALRALAPGRKPFHTLNPALALFDDGRVMTYGCMGGEGQPQTQAAVFSRYAHHGQTLQQAVTAPRWLLGRTWGAEATNLKLEGRFDPALLADLRARGHDIELVEDFSATMGHAGAVVRHGDGLLEGAGDPRSDGQAAGF